jgi:prolyl-tRNA editing enzyme YbaK/EbsC (Cys-tRNA(Pro) deacylase)
MARARAEPWPEPVERVAAHLRAGGVEARIEEHPAGTHSAEAAAHAVGCRLGQIVKSLVFDCAGRPVLVMVPGDRRADAAKVAAAAGCARARVAGWEQVEEATGFAPGAVAPFPLPGIDLALIDSGLMVYDRVWIGAGSASHLAALSPGDLARLARARWLDVAEPA